MTHPTNRATANKAERQNEVKMRASDADRHVAVQVLQDAIARGLLTPSEGSDRMSAAFAAVYQQDLIPITADLPGRPGRDEPQGWQPVLLMVLEQLQFSLRSAVTARRAARWGAALVLALLLIMCGSALAHLVLDNGGGRGHGGFGDR